MTKQGKAGWITIGVISLILTVISCAYGLGGKMAGLKYQYQIIEVKVEGNRMTNAEQTVILAQVKDSLHELDKSIAAHSIFIDELKERK